jgi:hypothetical protein
MACTTICSEILRPRYSARNASNGELKLARNAGINEAANAHNPSVTTAVNVTAGL